MVNHKTVHKSVDNAGDSLYPLNIEIPSLLKKGKGGLGGKPESSLAQRQRAVKMYGVRSKAGEKIINLKTPAL